MGLFKKVEGVVRGWGGLGGSPLSNNASVQGFLFYPDGSVDGETPPVLATQHVLAELGRVHASSTGGRHAETFLEKALQNLKKKRKEQRGGTLKDCQN